MSADFEKLIGMFIHQCGGLELLTNNCIRAFATDSLLSTDAIKSSFTKRIDLLRKLLHDRSNISKDEINSICDELKKICEKRNIVAHNPIMSKTPNGSGIKEILNLRYSPSEVTIPNKLTKGDISKLLSQTTKLLKKIGELIPESTKT